MKKVVESFITLSSSLLRSRKQQEITESLFCFCFVHSFILFCFVMFRFVLLLFCLSSGLFHLRVAVVSEDTVGQKELLGAIPETIKNI